MTVMGVPLFFYILCLSSAFGSVLRCVLVLVVPAKFRAGAVDAVTGNVGDDAAVFVEIKPDIDFQYLAACSTARMMWVSVCSVI